MRGKINKVVFILIGLILLVSVIIYFVSSHEREPFAPNFAESIYQDADTEMETLSRGGYSYVEPNLGRYNLDLELNKVGNIHMYDNLAEQPGFNDVKWVDRENITSFMEKSKINLKVHDIIHVPFENDYVNVNDLQRSFTPYRILEGNELEELPNIKFNPPPQEYTITDRIEPITDNDINVMNLQTKESLINSGRLTKIDSIQNVEPGFVYVDNTRVTELTLTDTSTGGKIITDKLGNAYTINAGNSPRELLSEFSNKNLKAGVTPEDIRVKIAGENRLNVADTNVTLGRERTAISSVNNKGGLTDTTIRLNDYRFPEDKNSFNSRINDGPVRSVKLKMADGSEEVIGHIVERRMEYRGILRADRSSYFKPPPDFIMDDGIFGPAVSTEVNYKLAPVELQSNPIYNLGSGSSEAVVDGYSPAPIYKVGSRGGEDLVNGYAPALDGSQDSGYNDPFALEFG